MNEANLISFSPSQGIKDNDSLYGKEVNGFLSFNGHHKNTRSFEKGGYIKRRI